MKKLKRIFALFLCLALCISAISLSACGQKGKVLMSINDKSVTLSTYTLLLSRMKGTLSYYGYEVESEDFWNTIISLDGLTYDDYFSTTILEELSEYLIADYLFSLEGLKLSQERESEVDAIMSALVKSAGSKTALNKSLKEFGVNIDMLREVYIIEAKIEQLKEHFYGKNGEKIDRATKEAYFEQNYVAFGQIFIPSYYYVTELDEFGDTVYYTDDKQTAIAYDTVNGETVTDEFGKLVLDKFKNPVYYTTAKKIAYDKANGRIGYVKDENGELIAELYSKDEIAKLYEKAKNYANECNGNIDTFLEYAKVYDGSDSLGETQYLFNESGYYASQAQDFAYLDKIASSLADMLVGECRVIEGSYGYHVICKYQLEAEAYENETHKNVFIDFNSNLIGALFDEKCAEYEGKIVIDYGVLDDAPSMSDVGTNKLY